MLEVARKKGIYRETHVADLSMPVDALASHSFDAAVLVGVFSYGQAPRPKRSTRSSAWCTGGGVGAFTLRTDFHAQDAMGVRSRTEALEQCGAWKLLERTDPAPYLPHKDEKALFQVWCYRVTGNQEAEVENGFEDAVREALESGDYVKEIDHAWIGDSTATRLYDRYTPTSGYYLTDCEEEILRDNAADIVGEECLIVELGCGSARKIRHILAACVERAGGVRYLPVDASPGALRATAADVRRTFGDVVGVEMRQRLFEDVLPELPVGDKKLVFFFGSSIGNLDTIGETVAFLERLRARLNPGDRFIVGVDLHKDEDVLVRAYNQEEACRSFFVHMLRRVNEHLGADFDTRVFELSSTYEEEPPLTALAGDAPAAGPLRTRRMNLRIAPTLPQHTWVQRQGLEVHLDPGQPVQVGISRKFEPEGIAALARLAGLRLGRQWFDRRRWFSLNELSRPDGP